MGAIITMIILSVQDGTKDSSELLSNNLTEIQAKAFCREAVNFGIKRVSDAGASSPPPTHLQTFTNFQITDGIIDSIQYTTSNDTIAISAYATYQNNSDTYQHKSTAIITWGSIYGDAAITANGPIDVSGSAIVNGNIIPCVNPVLDFEDFFGITKEEMKAMADYDLVNPSPNPDPNPDPLLCVSGITYVTTNQLKITTSAWAGTGILVVEGDARFNGGSFTGVIWVTGSLIINGNEGFDGAVYNEGIDPSGGEANTVPVLGNCEISYDKSAVVLALGYVGQVLTYKLKILSMHEDD